MASLPSALDLLACAQDKQTILDPVHAHASGCHVGFLERGGFDRHATLRFPSRGYTAEDAEVSSSDMRPRISNLDTSCNVCVWELDSRGKKNGHLGKT